MDRRILIYVFSWILYCRNIYEYIILSYIYKIIHIHHIISLLTGDMNSINWPRSQCVHGFIAQLVQQRNGNAEVMGSDPVEALIFFRLLLSNCLNWKIHCDDHSSLSSTTAVQKWIISLLHIMSLLTGDMNSINWPSPDFFQASSFQLLELENLLRWSFFTFKRYTVYHFRSLG